ncbi:MAG: general secretion pathway protein GspN [Bradyrhizobium sp.]|uniref:general secretion pathway protein GspN n=1 Tax=Bradyrhizobium sp. TaxID=376 RepID=UPI001D71771B|nr:general secretion pathway protein GspN [Bradyrhizobium sp.]MBV9562651.1 general secretion pathway protein GspN [Bradyrhizobium sp.]
MAPALLVLLGIPGSTFALPTDSSAVDTDAARRPESPSVSAIWDQPATPATVVEVRPPEPTPVASEQTRSENPLWAIPLATLSNTRDRPIFSASRRPPPPPVTASVPAVTTPSAAPKPARTEPPPIALTGTILGQDESYGIFVDPASKTPLRLKIGEDYQGWKLRSVQAGEVTLVRDQQTVILTLPPPGSAAAEPARPQIEAVGARAAEASGGPPEPPQPRSRQR